MCSGPVPQHPPMSWAPQSAQRIACWRYCPGVRPVKTQFGGTQWPFSAYAPTGPAKWRRMISIASGITSGSECITVTAASAGSARALSRSSKLSPPPRSAKVSRVPSSAAARADAQPHRQPGPGGGLHGGTAVICGLDHLQNDQFGARIRQQLRLLLVVGQAGEAGIGRCRAVGSGSASAASMTTGQNDDIDPATTTGRAAAASRARSAAPTALRLASATRLPSPAAPGRHGRPRTCSR